MRAREIVSNSIQRVLSGSSPTSLDTGSQAPRVIPVLKSLSVVSVIAALVSAILSAQAGAAKIGIVEQRLFEHANQGVAWREQAERRLATTGWVDRDKGVVHIPIDRAMEMVEKGERP